MSDRVAQRAKPIPGSAPQLRGLLQRKCVCGTHTPGGATCASCDGAAKRLQRKSLPGGMHDAVPTIVHDVLRSTGRPLAADTRSFMESRFNQDFSRVRVHADSHAAQSARAVDARAYTVGRNVVFGAGQYAPGTESGRHLLAHELAHVVQQDFAPAPNTKLTVVPDNDRSESEADQIASDALASRPLRSGSPLTTKVALQRKCYKPPLPAVAGCTALSGEIEGESFLFNVNCDDFRTDTGPPPHVDLPPGEEGRLRAFAETLRDGDTLKIHGFASSEGDASYNEELSCLRAIKAASVIRAVAFKFGVSPNYELFKHGASAGPKDEKRAVVIDIQRAAPAPEAEAAKPQFLCGPDITSALSSVCNKTRTTFAGWSSSQKSDACDALISLRTGGYAWDIVELHNNAWILNYRPTCATQGATPPCGSSVQVEKDCHYAGSANYVIFGVMCQLCNDHYKSIKSSSASDFTEGEMLKLIDKYKGTGFTGLGTPSGNFVASQRWSTAGFRGWPGYYTPPGDRSNCSPTCPTAYNEGALSVHWVPMGVF